MAISDFYDFGPLMAQLQQGGQGMSGGMGTPQNTWNGTQFQMPTVAPQAPFQPLDPYKGTAMAPGGTQQAGGGLFGSLADPSAARRVRGRPGAGGKYYSPALQGLMG
jgi:hypothetical protein